MRIRHLYPYKWQAPPRIRHMYSYMWQAPRKDNGTWLCSAYSRVPLRIHLPCLAHARMGRKKIPSVQRPHASGSPLPPVLPLGGTHMRIALLVTSLDSTVRGRPSGSQMLQASQIPPRTHMAFRVLFCVMCARGRGRAASGHPP